MKTLLVVSALLVSGLSYAHNHDEKDKKVSHDKEHSHVTSDKMDHEHKDEHHKDHDHKAHHPEHKEEEETKTKK